MAKKKKKKWIKKAAASMKKRKTVGSFTAWCARNGFGSNGVTAACIAKGLKSKDPAIRKKAAFAKASRTIARRKKKK